MQGGKAWALLKKNEVCYISAPIKFCEDCGEDLRKFNIRRVASASDYMQR
jgi:hypothetical protein